MVFRSPFVSPLRSPFGDSAAAAEDFAATLVNTYGASEVWKLTDITSGTTIPAYVDSARNGELSGWTLQSDASPVIGDSGLAPYSDGVNDKGSIYSASLNSIWTPDEMSIIMFAKVNTASVWTDGSFRVALWIANAITTNDLGIYKSSANNSLSLFYRGGGTIKETFVTMSPTGWFSAGLSASKSGNAIRFYVNGSQVGATQTFAEWSADTLSSTACTLLCRNYSPAGLIWNGFGAWCAMKVGGIWSPTDFANIHTDATT